MPQVRGCRGLRDEREELAVGDRRQLGGRLHELGILVGRGKAGRHRVGVFDLPHVVNLVDVADHGAPSPYELPTVLFHDAPDGDHRLVGRGQLAVLHLYVGIDVWHSLTP